MSAAVALEKRSARYDSMQCYGSVLGTPVHTRVDDTGPMCCEPDAYCSSAGHFG